MKSRTRDWSRRTFYDPEPVLRELRGLEVSLSDAEIPDVVRRLRTNPLKPEREGRDALLFAHGMATALGVKVFVAPGEVEDCDFITRATVSDTQYFSCVQLKELAPEDLSPKQTLAPLIAKLQKLPSSDAVLAIHLNRRISIPLAELASARVPFAELWYFWAADPSLGSWHLFGDVMQSPALHQFEYPK